VAIKLDTLLKLSVIASLFVASSGVAYYYAVYLPARDAQRDEERLAEDLRSDALHRAEAARALAEQQQSAERRAADKAAADDRYATCLTSASTSHDDAWSAACKRLADQAEQDRTGCFASTKLPRGYCDAVYKTRDASPHCALPVKVSTGLDGDLTLARKRCLQQRNAILQGTAANSANSRD